MRNDALDGGVAPGGLRLQSDILLLVCYMIASVNQPISRDDIVKVITYNGIANYFETVSAIDFVIKHGNADTVDGNPYLYVANDNTKEISTQLHSQLPISIRDKAEEGALRLLAQQKIEAENQVEIEKADNGYDVTCHISGGNYDLLKFTLRVSDYNLARKVKNNFHKNPKKVYQAVVGLMLNDNSFIKSVLTDD